MGFEVKKETVSKNLKRVIPVDANNEQYLLGHAINDVSLLETLLAEIEDHNFLYVNHQVLMSTIRRLFSQRLNTSVDNIETMRKEIQGGEKLNLKYIVELASTFNKDIRLDDYKFHILKLKDDKIKDSLSLYHLPRLQDLLINPQSRTDQIIAEISKIKDDIEEGYTSSDFGFVQSSIIDVEHTAQLKIREEGGVFGSTGYKTLDEYLTDGFSETKMTVIAGRPAMGKSAILANMLLRLAMKGIAVAFYNFEMDCISMFDRLVAIDSQIPLEKIIKSRHRLTEQERQQELASKEMISKLPIYFYKNSTQTIEGVRKDLRILKDKYGVSVIGYDLFDKMKLRSGGGNRSTADIINDALKTIQGYGRDFKIHQIVVVQINRSVEKRKDKRPMLSDLKDAGGYEERADNVLFLFRPEYYSQLQESIELDSASYEDIEVIIAKQRQGVSNIKALLRFFPVTTMITDLDGS